MQAARSVASARAQARNTTGATHARASPRRAVSRCLLEKQPEADETVRFPGKFVGGKAPEDLPRHLQERNRISTPWDAARIELAERFGASEAELDKAADISDEHLSEAYTMMQICRDFENECGQVRGDRGLYGREAVRHGRRQRTKRVGHRSPSNPHPRY